MSKDFILASSSPRRKDILKLTGIDFECIPADIDETFYSSLETPSTYVQRVSIAKAEKIAMLSKNSNALVIGADVTIDINNTALAKAESKSEARTMMSLLSCKRHFVRTGYAIYFKKEILAFGVNSSIVKFREITENELNKYFEQEDWKGKAGAYAIQGEAAKFVEYVQGSYFDILGLPIYNIYGILETLGLLPIVSISEIRKAEQASHNLKVIKL